MYGPIIQGSNFRLHPPRLEEAKSMVGWFEQLEVTRRWIWRFPHSLEQEEKRLREKADDPNTIYWAIESEDELIGGTSIEEIDWVNRNGSTVTIIGRVENWGKGIGRELMQRRTSFAFTELPLIKLKSSYIEGNEASRRTQLGAGYQEVGRYRKEFFREGRWMDLILTELLREDWERCGP